MHKTKKIFNNSGFSLIEIVVTLAITGVVSAAIFSVYNISLKTNTTQIQVADVQQDVRAGLFLMTRELRMAGYDTSRLAGSGITITSTDFSPGDNQVQFTSDLNGDGDLTDTDENVRYALYPEDGMTKLGRNVTGAPAPLVENAQALGIAYAIDDGSGHLRTNASGTIWAVIGANGNWFDLDDNEDGNIDAVDDAADGATDGVITGRDLLIAADTDEIRAVKVWLLARSQAPDNSYTNNQEYVVGNSVLTYNDNFRRRLLTSTVKCRNMGL